MTKSFESDYGKSEGSKGFEKIFLGDNENLYIGKEGRAWYVSKGPDGKTTKMLVQIDETTGEMNVVGIAGKGDYAKSDGSQGIQKISMGDNDNLYITQEGEFWYTSSGSKALVDIDDNTGEIIVLQQFNSDDEKDATTAGNGKSEY